MLGLLLYMMSLSAQRIRQTLSRDPIDIDIPKQRLAWEQSARLVKTPQGVDISIVEYNGVRCMLHTVKDSPNPSNLIVYFHGGGLVEGSIETSREWCSRIALATDLAVLSIDYRLAPENPYPAAQIDVKLVLDYFATEQPNVIVSSVGADSSGCNLLLGGLFYMRTQGCRPPASAFLLSPSIDLSFSGNSFRENTKLDPLISLAVLENYAELYAGRSDRKSEEISPLYGEFHNLPPMLIYVDSDEVLFDDSTQLAKYVEEAGGVASLVISSGLWHTWPTWGDFPESREALQQIREHILCPNLTIGCTRSFDKRREHGLRS